MKKFLPLLGLLFVVQVATAVAGQRYATILDIDNAVRDQVSVYSHSLLPESTLMRFSARGVELTAVDAGGVETSYRLLTVAGTPFYKVPDSIVEVVSVTAINRPFTKSLVEIPPQLFDKLFDMPKLSGISPEQVPVAYHLWSDSIQLMPVPLKIDTLYLNATVRHPKCTDTATSVVLPDDFCEAAIFYTAKLVSEYLKEFEQAAYFEKQWGARVALLRNLYRPPSDVTKPKE